jgi:hypothetical protein
LPLAVALLHVCVVFNFLQRSANNVPMGTV